VTTLAANWATSRGVVVTNAAGNLGHDGDSGTSHLVAPGDGMDVITVGAVDSAGTIAGFSSDGPTADGRVKPEVLAFGVGNTVMNPAGGYGSGSGTSFATPLVAAAAALIVEAHPDWSVRQIRDALIGTASRGGSFDPQYVYGYGIADAYAAINLPEPGTLAVLGAAMVAGVLSRARRGIKRGG
jgi:subtilisin family serine protease